MQYILWRFSVAYHCSKFVPASQLKGKAHELKMEKAEKIKYLSLLPALPEDIPITFIVGILKA